MVRTLETTSEELRQEVAGNLAALYPVEWEELQSNEELRGKTVLLRQEGNTLAFVCAYDSVPRYLKLEQSQILAKIPAPPKPSTLKVAKVSGETSWRLEELLKGLGRNPVRLTPSGEKIYPVEQGDAAFVSQEWSPEVTEWEGKDVLPEDSLAGIAD